MGTRIRDSGSTLAGSTDEMAARTLVLEGMERFREAVSRCPPRFTSSGMDLQQDWVHQPDFEMRPWGTWCEEWTNADGDAFNSAAARIRSAVRRVTGKNNSEIDDLDALLPNKLTTLIRGSEQLIQHYDAMMLAQTPKPKPKSSPWPWLIGAALFAVVLRK